jgi:hypothetical protein
MEAEPPSKAQSSNRLLAMLAKTKIAALHESAYGPKRTFQRAPSMSALGGKADIPPHYRHVRF